VLSLVLVAMLLVLVNIYTNWLDPVRSRLNVVATPFYWITDLPGRFSRWGEEISTSEENLRLQNVTLEQELLIHKRKLQTMAALAAENVRLRQLLNSAEMIQDRVLVAELIGVSPDPQRHTVVVNKGSNDGVYVGQPLLDAFGLMGQVIELSLDHSVVLLATDATHALPVQINRNGVRAVAEGVGDLYQLKLRHVSNTVDIREGDLLVSSGLGQRFPSGYPVAEVASVVRDPGQPFATVIARPMAQMNRSRHVLLVFSKFDGES